MIGKKYSIWRMLIVTGLLLTLTPGINASNNKARCIVLTVQATNDGKGIAKPLQVYSDILKAPPFSSYDSFEVVEQKTVELALSTPKSLTLPESITGSLKLNGFSNKKFDLTLILKRGTKPPITIRGQASPGTPLIAAGMTSPKGIWVFGVICDESYGTTNF